LRSLPLVPEGATLPTAAGNALAHPAPVWNSAMKVTLSIDTAFYSYHVGSMCLLQLGTPAMRKPGWMQERETCGRAIST
jgi:hypothetical protein